MTILNRLGVHIKISKPKIWFSFFLYKIIASLVGVFIYTQYTQLADAFNYVSDYYKNVSGFYAYSTITVSYLAGFLNNHIGFLLTNIIFSIISFLGVYYSVSRLDLNVKNIIWFLLFLSFPNFVVWNSIISKESFVVLFFGVFLNFVHLLISGDLKPYHFLFLMLSLIGMFIFKAQYLIVMLFIGLFAFINTLNISIESKKKSIYIFISLSFFFVLLNISLFNDLLSKLLIHFSGTSSFSTRDPFWDNEYDFILKAPEGVLIAFSGVYFSEALSKTTHFLTFFEFWLFAIFISLYVYRYFKPKMLRESSYKFLIWIFFIGILLLLGLHYPLGIMNPGSAIRYRAGFIVFIISCVFTLVHYSQLRRKIALEE